MAALQRVLSYQDLVSQLSTRVSPDHSCPLPGLAVETLPGHSQLAPQLLHSDGQTWLVSVTPLAEGADGAPRSLKVSQNVTASVQQQPQELRPIATAFNAMQQHLATSWEQQRAFVDGVAHELPRC